MGRSWFQIEKHTRFACVEQDGTGLSGPKDKRCDCVERLSPSLRTTIPKSLFTRPLQTNPDKNLLRRETLRAGDGLTNGT